MKLSNLLTVFFLVLGLAMPSLNARAETSASAVVQKFYDQLTATMKDGDKLGFTGRYKKMEPAVKEAFNLPLMARVSAGPAFTQASAEDQQKLVDAFTTFSVANYASQFTKDGGEKFQIVGEKPATGGGTIVETNLVPKDGEPVALNYLVRADDKGQLRIADVFLDASISQLAMRRSEFTAIIKREGFAALISSLNEKNKKMGMT